MAARFSVAEIADSGATVGIVQQPGKSTANWSSEFESNDSFAFWKLDEGWRGELSSDIEQSRVCAEKYLFEQYLSERQRRPPRLDLYYALKGLIPRAIRHRLNRYVVTMRPPMPFPAWPYEATLLSLRCSWLEDALKQIEL